MAAGNQNLGFFETEIFSVRSAVSENHAACDLPWHCINTTRILPQNLSWWCNSWGPKGRNSGPKAESGGVLGDGSEPPPHQLENLWSTVSSPSGVRAEPWPQMHLDEVRAEKKVSSGHKCRFVLVCQFDSVSGVLPILDFLGELASSTLWLRLCTSGRFSDEPCFNTMLQFGAGNYSVVFVTGCNSL